VEPTPRVRRPFYSEQAGSNLGRLEAISDGIFAVGMTLLVLGLAVPLVSQVKTEADLLGRLGSLLPSLIAYFMSFLTLGIFWVGQQTQLSQAVRANRTFTWIHLTFLLSVTLVPFSTQLLARFDWSRVAMAIYWLDIVVMGFALAAGAEYGARAHLFPEEQVKELLHLVRRRVYWAQGLYFIAVLFSVIDTRLSIALIVLIQLNFALAPPIPFLRSI
jgi:uncharacterized membrane protein